MRGKNCLWRTWCCSQLKDIYPLEHL
jgi:hypothetical protein